MRQVHGFIRAAYALKRHQPTIARRVISAAAIESPLKKVFPAEPGSVKPHDHHLFLEVAGEGCMQGIPPDLRPPQWFVISGAAKRASEKLPMCYRSMVALGQT